MPTNIDGYATHRGTVGDRSVRIASYRLGGHWYACVDDLDPASTLGRAHGGSREEAERVAMERAAERIALARSRGIPADL